MSRKLPQPISKAEYKTPIVIKAVNFLLASLFFVLGAIVITFGVRFLMILWGNVCNGS